MLMLMLASAILGSDLESGLKAGESAPQLTIYAITGESKEKSLDIVKQRGELPTVFLFLNSAKFDRPIARYMRELDQKSADACEKVHVVAIWVQGDLEKNKDYLPKVHQSLKFDRTTLASFETDQLPNGWGLNSDAHLTTIVVHKGKVLKSFAYQSTNDKDVPAVLEVLKKAK
jgi:hypothetical protein